MEAYQNFQLATIVWAYYLKDADEAQMQKDIEYILSYIPLKKAYLENHRGLVDVPPEKMRLAKAVFERNGIEASGCITSTDLVGERKPSIFDTYCFTEESHRAAYLKIVEELAGVFDEIILDDYFFTACRCEKCIDAKGDRSWSEYRLDLMEDFSRTITQRAREVNPKMNFIIKYPNWYESWQEVGYNPEKQKDIFDMVYTGTETREAVYSQQHLQRYQSYSLVRYLENTAPGRNGGGWIDPGGSGDNLSRWLEQADQTLFAKAKELALFNFESIARTNVLPPLGKELYRVDRLLSETGKPVGVCAYEPFNGQGEDSLYNYLGMGGVPIEPTPYFDESAPVIFFAQSAGQDPDVMARLKAYVRKGGNAVVTTGFFREQYENGIRDMTSLRLTGRHMSGSEFLVFNRNYGYDSICVAKGRDDVLFEVLQYKTNASWANVSVINGAYNFPLLSEDDYGQGRLFILNVPENFADLYKLPVEVWTAVSKHLSMGHELYAASNEQVSLFAYDNHVYGIESYASHNSTVRVFIRGESRGIQDVESGKVWDVLIPQPLPSPHGDSCACIPEPPEFAVDVKLGAGEYRFFRVLRP